MSLVTFFFLCNFFLLHRTDRGIVYTAAVHSVTDSEIKTLAPIAIYFDNHDIETNEEFEWPCGLQNFNIQ